jgi:hypothetical protein
MSPLKSRGMASTVDVRGDGVQMDEADGLMQPMPELEPVFGKAKPSP